MPPDQFPRQNPRVAWRTYEGEAVIISPDDSSMHALNAVGTRVWEAADGLTSVGTIAQRISGEFDVDEARARRDVATFVDTLCARGLMTLTTDPRERGAAMSDGDRPPTEGAAEARRPYEAPAITSEPIFETTALACAKMPGQSAACNMRSRNS